MAKTARFDVTTPTVKPAFFKEAIASGMPRNGKDFRQGRAHCIRDRRASVRRQPQSRNPVRRQTLASGLPEAAQPWKQACYRAGLPKHRLGGVAHAFQNGSIGVEHRAVQVEQRHIALRVQGNKGIGHDELSSFKNDLHSEARPNITIHKPTSKTAKAGITHFVPPKERFNARRAAPHNSPSSPRPLRRFARSRAARHGS